MNATQIKPEKNNNQKIANQNKENNQNKIQTTEDIIIKTNELYEEIYELSQDTENKKYQYLPYWKEKEAKILLREIRYPRKFFSEYKRGTIIRVDFGVNIGCEFSQIHYAIVLNKKDNRMSETISVIPLTSKNKESNLSIGNIIFNSAINALNEKIQDFIDEDGNPILKSKDDMQKIKKMSDILEYYSKNPVASYACYKNIITISKRRIMKPINEYDFINKTLCSEKIMKEIDKKIIEYYTEM